MAQPEMTEKTSPHSPSELLESGRPGPAGPGIAIVLGVLARRSRHSVPPAPASTGAANCFPAELSERGDTLAASGLYWLLRRNDWLSRGPSRSRLMPASCSSTWGCLGVAAVVREIALRLGPKLSVLS